MFSIVDSIREQKESSGCYSTQEMFIYLRSGVHKQVSNFKPCYWDRVHNMASEDCVTSSRCHIEFDHIIIDIKLCNSIGDQKELILTHNCLGWYMHQTYMYALQTIFP